VRQAARGRRTSCLWWSPPQKAVSPDFAGSQTSKRSTWLLRRPHIFCLRSSALPAKITPFPLKKAFSEGISRWLGRLFPARLFNQDKHWEVWGWLRLGWGVQSPDIPADAPPLGPRGAGPHPHCELPGETSDSDQPDLELFPTAPRSGGAAQVRQGVRVMPVRMIFLSLWPLWPLL